MSSPSASVELARSLDAILRRTEARIKHLERIRRAFAAPVLNEWRYATRHAVNAMLLGEDGADECAKAVKHVKRAYFDSSDILLTTLLGAVRDFLSDCAGYEDVAAAVVPRWQPIMDLCEEAREALERGEGATEEEKEARCEAFDPIISPLPRIAADL